MQFELVDIGGFLAESENRGANGLSKEAFEACQKVARSFRETGCCLVLDPRVPPSENDSFLDLMEDYFGQEPGWLEEDERSYVSDQAGCTAEGVEVPRCVSDPLLQTRMASYAREHRATMPRGPDPKRRVFWRFRLPTSKPRTPRSAPGPLKTIIPRAFAAQWAPAMNGWGARLVECCLTVAEMLSVGLGLPGGALPDLMEGATHLLGPTGTNMEKNGQVGTVLAGYHYDLNLITIHGRSRYPGLFVWLRDGRRVPVRIPEGCLLLQAGKQLEWVTGGEVAAVYHEVVCTEATLSALSSARSSGRPPWRVSSTVFAHAASDALLRPMGQYATKQAMGRYPEVYCGEFVRREVEALSRAKELAPAGPASFEPAGPAG